MVDYSKWDKFDFSDSDEERQPAPKVRTEKDVKSQAPQLAKPQTAQGSSWNAQNYHWEEAPWDKWAEAELRKIFDKRTTADEIEFQNSRILFSHVFGVEKCEGEAWAHIRKGKSVVGYNFVMEAACAGRVMMSARQEDVHVAISMDLVVDAEPEVTMMFQKGKELPFVPDIKKRILGTINEGVGEFVEALQARAAKKYQTTSAPSNTSKESNVQVGGHNPQGARIS